MVIADCIWIRRTVILVLSQVVFSLCIWPATAEEQTRDNLMDARRAEMLDLNEDIIRSQGPKPEDGVITYRGRIRSGPEGREIVIDDWAVAPLEYDEWTGEEDRTRDDRIVSKDQEIVMKDTSAPSVANSPSYGGVRAMHGEDVEEGGLSAVYEATGDLEEGSQIDKGFTTDAISIFRPSWLLVRDQMNEEQEKKE